jgi:two-component system, NarL family, sensor histidine kinase UhpB
LHDNINQILASAKLFLDTAMSNEEMWSTLLCKSRKSIVHAIDEIRQLSHSLVPPPLGDCGLQDALKELVEQLNPTGLFTTRLWVNDFDESLFNGPKKLMVFRIVQEQVNNIIKYAKATEVIIHIKISNERFVLTIADNGVGFAVNSKPNGIGLKNIESRVSYYSGKMKHNSVVGQGTSLEITLPLQ